MKITKKDKRLRRAKKTRVVIRRLEMPRLCVHRTPRHIYVQIISEDGASTLVSASTLDKSIGGVKYTGNVEAAKKIGEEIAKKALKAGIKKVAFDRSGFKYHGRIKALADSAREAGLEI